MPCATCWAWPTSRRSTPSWRPWLVAVRWMASASWTGSRPAVGTCRPSPTSWSPGSGRSSSGGLAVPPTARKPRPSSWPRWPDASPPLTPTARWPAASASSSSCSSSGARRRPCRPRSLPRSHGASALARPTHDRRPRRDLDPLPIRRPRPMPRRGDARTRRPSHHPGRSPTQRTRHRPPRPHRSPTHPTPASTAATGSTPRSAPAPAHSGSPKPNGDEALRQLRGGWRVLVAHVSQNPANRPLIEAARPVEVSDGVVVLGFPEDQAFLRDIAERKKRMLEEAVARGHGCRLRGPLRGHQRGRPRRR